MDCGSENGETDECMRIDCKQKNTAGIVQFAGPDRMMSGIRQNRTRCRRAARGARLLLAGAQSEMTECPHAMQKRREFL